MDPVKEELPKKEWDIITSFEVFEHIGKNNGKDFLENIKSVMNKDTIFLLSTPCFDEKIGAAGNHVFDSGDDRGIAIQEYSYKELEELLNKHFKIEKVFGTFASQRDYKPYLSEAGKKMYDKLNEYYDSNLISNIFAPLFPNSKK